MTTEKKKLPPPPDGYYWTFVNGKPVLVQMPTIEELANEIIHLDSD